ncbi:Protein kintoun [Kappamyces sp. JEL0829]|nr:Protein kintoun [Kappamyces sp. JEL0829]
MTNEEFTRFQKGMENPEFKKLFFDYMNEISDPKNKELYEKELAALEGEKGFKVRYVKPTPGFCVKTTTTAPGEAAKKTFVNICSSSEILPPTAVSRHGSGQSWDIPYSLAVGREDVDHEQKPCVVHDVVYHPAALEKGMANARFKDLLAQTALEGLEKQFALKVDVKDFKILKNTKSKGTPLMTMIKEKDESLKTDGETSLTYIEKLAESMQNSTLDPVETKTAAPAPAGRLEIPKFKIVHQNTFQDYQKFTGEKEKSYGARPDFLVIKIELPKLKSANGVDLDVNETTLDLAYPSLYKLHLDLPFPVKHEEGSATFEKATATLVIRVPVIPAPKIELVAADATVPIERDDAETEPGAVEAASTKDTEQTVQPSEAAVCSTVTDSSQPGPADIEEVTKALEQIQIVRNPTPPFHSQQNPETATFILTVGGIVASTVQIHAEKQRLKLDFATEVQSYTLEMETPRSFATHEWTVTPSNLCLLLLKAEPSMWPHVEVVDQQGAKAVLSFATLSSVPHPEVDNTALEATADVEIHAKQKPNHVVVEAKNKASTVESAPPAATKTQFLNNLLFDLDE